jgi:hypothetical protein
MIKVAEIKSFELKCNKCSYSSTMTEDEYNNLDFSIKFLNKCSECGDKPKNEPKKFKGGLIRNPNYKGIRK